MRIRSIKPEFWEDEKLAMMEPNARLLFIALWQLADRNGVLEYRPDWIRVKAFPYGSNGEAVDVSPLLLSLIDGGFLVQYEIDGKRYLLVKKFRQHQRIVGKEAQSPARHPLPDWEATGKQPGSNREATEMPREQGAGSREQGVVSPHPIPSRLSILTAHKAVVSSRVPQSEWDDAIGKMNDSELEELLKLAKGSGKDGGIFPSDLEAAKVLLKEKREAGKWKGIGKYI